MRVPGVIALFLAIMVLDSVATISLFSDAWLILVLGALMVFLFPAIYLPWAYICTFYYWLRGQSWKPEAPVRLIILTVFAAVPTLLAALYYDAIVDRFAFVRKYATATQIANTTATLLEVYVLACFVGAIIAVLVELLLSYWPKSESSYN